MLVTVHFNTVIHPFTLADNRHYTFYVFRILRQHWLLKYAAVLVYFVCSCLVLGALSGGNGTGGGPKPTPGSNKLSLEKKPGEKQSTQKILYQAEVDQDDTVRMNWVLIWLVATSMSLVTAPLVEPRYFIVPWLTWRLAVPEYPPAAAPPAPVSASEEKREQPSSLQRRSDSAVRDTASTSSSTTTTLVSRVQAIVRTAALYSFPLELLWYLLVNLVTCYVFLDKGFEWPQEPGNVQRFMW
ncbi:hypothetical protein ABEF95_003570 [Exophiala dermatitidis]